VGSSNQDANAEAGCGLCGGHNKAIDLSTMKTEGGQTQGQVERAKTAKKCRRESREFSGSVEFTVKLIRPKTSLPNHVLLYRTRHDTADSGAAVLG